ncbi:quinoprotein dehydrogenase-associated putative ABC transporter substrate-binding protein [Candidatus Rariloculus sp.]|uniref:quinoprotein dehydrogenase-associated putative ABC transporter substrate-binding protein n=1 Tax=Candidatus Rariloculus sp. TaxID=3101265 RepID=UPI003D131DE7
MNTLRAAALIAAGIVAAAPGAAQQAPETFDVCADPNNLPFSNREGQGFENRLAEIWARELGVEARYTWFPHRRGFERNTLNAQDPVTGEYRCDVIVGVPDNYDLAITTEPYYRSTYALVYVTGRGLEIGSGQELIDLPRTTRDALRIGVFTPGPAADWLARYGMHGQMVPYSALGGDPDVYPGQIIENELVADELDAAIVWGPIAGYFAARAEGVDVAVVPLRSEPGVQFDFAISAGARFGDRETRALLENLIARTTEQTAALLAEYHVPVIAEAPAELVYVTNEDAGTISIISPATQTVIGEVQVGTRPRGVEVSGDGNLVYVALSGSPKCPPTMPDEECARLDVDKSKDGIGVIDARRGTVIEVLPGGSDPEEFDVDAAGTRLYVSNEDADQLSVVDLTTGEVLHTVEVGSEPEGVRLRPDGETVYVTSESDHAVTVVDARSAEVLGTITVGWRPRDSIFSADSARAYVSAEHGSSVAVVDVATSSVLETIALPPGSLPMGLVLSPDEQRLYVANGRARTVSVIELETSEVVAQVEVGARPWGVGLTADGRYLYTANGPSNDVSVIDTESLSVIATIPVGQTPWGIAIGPPPQAF